MPCIFAPQGFQEGEHEVVSVLDEGISLLLEAPVVGKPDMEACNHIGEHRIVVPGKNLSTFNPFFYKLL